MKKKSFFFSLALFLLFAQLYAGAHFSGEFAQQTANADSLRFVEDEVDPNAPINIRDYFPTKQSSIWKYSRLVGDDEIPGGTLTVRISGTEKICGMNCVRLEAVPSYPEKEAASRKKAGSVPSEKTTIYFVIDDSGLWFARYALPSGAYTESCPPQKVLPGQVEVGEEYEYSHHGLPCRLPDGTSCGATDGEGSYRILGYEDVETPAGIFPNCLGILRKYSFESSEDPEKRLPAFSITEETWHARDIGVVKRTYAEEEYRYSQKIRELEETFLLEYFSVPK